MNTLSVEQELAIATIKQEDISLLKLSAVAGSGKTHTLRAIAEAINPSNGLYLAYNKAIAQESKGKFPNSISCMTTHSLAYQNTVKPFKLTIGFFNYRDVKERIPFEEKLLLINTLDAFCVSEYLKVDDYCKANEISESIAKLVGSYMNKMKFGEMPSTHGFYLKYYHLLLASEAIIHDEFGLIMLDESGDINPVTLEIFKLLPSKKKIMVGDQAQAIYSFNGTINGFEAMKGIGTQLNLSKSFRVHKNIAKLIEHFMVEYIDPDAVFTGVEHKDMTIKSEAYITRTNGELISKMIECIREKIPFNLTRPAKSIFDLPLILMNLKHRGFISSPQWKFLQDDVNQYHSSKALQANFSSALGYIASEHSFDSSISTACNLLRKYDFDDVQNAFKYAKKHEKEHGHNLTIGTAHSMKGLESDHVEISTGLNIAVSKVIEKIQDNKKLTTDDRTELLLYYVAVSRAIKSISNAEHLENYLYHNESIDKQFDKVISKEVKQLELDYK